MTVSYEVPSAGIAGAFKLVLSIANELSPEPPLPQNTVLRSLAINKLKLYILGVKTFVIIDITSILSSPGLV